MAGLVPIDGAQVLWNNVTQQLGVLGSSARFKYDIKPMDRSSETILELQPVTFRYKHEIDPSEVPQFGLVAEEVAKVNPDLVVNDEQGKPYTVRYEAVNAMLLNEFLKQHQKVAAQDSKSQKQDATIRQLMSLATEQQKQIKDLTANLKAQAGQIQKVSAQLAAGRPEARLVSSGR